VYKEGFADLVALAPGLPDLVAVTLGAPTPVIYGPEVAVGAVTPVMKPLVGLAASAFSSSNEMPLSQFFT